MLIKTAFKSMALSAVGAIMSLSALAAPHMATGDAAVAPRGFIGFCLRYQGECKSAAPAPVAVDLTEDGEQCVTIVVPLLEPEPVATGPERSTEAPVVHDWRRPTAVALASVSVALGLVGAGFGWAAIRAHDRAESDCARQTPCAVARANDADDFHADAMAANITLAAAGIGLVGAAVLWWTAPEPDHAGAHVTVRPVVQPTIAGLALSGGW